MYVCVSGIDFVYVATMFLQRGIFFSSFYCCFNKHILIIEVLLKHCLNKRENSR
jgi:hypothetical protein